MTGYRGYYSDAPQAEVDEALARLGIRNHRNATSYTASMIGDKRRDQLGDLVDRTYTSDPDAHADALDQIDQAVAKPDPEPFNAHTATNREYVDYLRRNGLPVSSHAHNASLVRPDEIPYNKHNRPTGDAA